MLLKGKEIAYLGILLAINQIFIVLSSIIKSNTLLLFALAALIIGIVVIEFNWKSGFSFYITSCILGYFLTFNKIEIFLYILFFGLYSLIKYFVESCFEKNKIVISMLLKLGFFNISLGVLYLIFKNFVLIKGVYLAVAFLGAQVGFIIYDYVFSSMLRLYIDKIKPKIKM